MKFQQTDNLYENWIKKHTMNTIIHSLKQYSFFDEHPHFIYLSMIEELYQNINNSIHLLNIHSHQYKYCKRLLYSIYSNLYTVYTKDYCLCETIQYYYFKNKKDVKELLQPFTSYEIDDEYLPIETFFRGIHQLIEVNLLYLLHEHNKIEVLMDIENETIKDIIYHCISIWKQLIETLHLLSSLDELYYQKYRNMIYGTSGGESINLRKLQKKIQNLDTLLSFDIYETIVHKKKDRYLISAVKLYQYYSTQFWLTHFNLASSTNGIQNKGTKETPVLQLIDKCIHMVDTKINRSIYDVSQEVCDPSSRINICIQTTEKSIGKSIYNSSKEFLKKNK